MGCPTSDYCLPSWEYGNGTDGIACPFSCPVKCPEDQLTCIGGFDDNNCQKPNICIEKSGNHCLCLNPLQRQNKFCTGQNLKYILFIIC